VERNEKNEKNLRKKSKKLQSNKILWDEEKLFCVLWTK
jgi:hypothetical protein